MSERKNCQADKDKFEKTLTEKFENEKTLITTSWKFNVQRKLKVQMKELNDQCLEETKKLTKQMQTTHTSKENAL